MPKFNVDLYPAMLLPIVDIEADSAHDAIIKAVDKATAQLVGPAGHGRHTLIFGDEFVRYVVKPVTIGIINGINCQTFLDAAHLAADAQDQADGLPLYERPARAEPRVAFCNKDA